MNIGKNIYKAVFSPLEVINREKLEGKLQASIIVVLTTVLFGSILAPVLYYFSYRSKYELSLNIVSIFTVLLASLGTWLAACTLFWLLAVMFKKQVDFGTVLSTWGFSYVPNLMCIIAYSLIQSTLGFLISNAIIGFIANTFFIMLLVWKAIFYFIEMRFVIGTTGRELLIITLIAGVVFAALMWIGFWLGIQIPML